MRNEIRSQRLLQFMQVANNPAMAPFIKYDYILWEIATSMDLDEDLISMIRGKRLSKLK